MRADEPNNVHGHNYYYYSDGKLGLEQAWFGDSSGDELIEGQFIKYDNYGRETDVIYSGLYGQFVEPGDKDIHRTQADFDRPGQTSSDVTDFGRGNTAGTAGYAAIESDDDFDDETIVEFDADGNVAFERRVETIDAREHVEINNTYFVSRFDLFDENTSRPALGYGEFYISFDPASLQENDVPLEGPFRVVFEAYSNAQMDNVVFHIRMNWCSLVTESGLTSIQTVFICMQHIWSVSGLRKT